jgi:hypothetical protein
VNLIIRERILRKLFPEIYQQVDKAKEIVANYQELKSSLKIVDGVVNIEGPAGILGEMNNCEVSITPKIYPELVLSKYELDSMLKIVGGRGQLISSNLFNNYENKERMKSAKKTKKGEL